MNKVRNDGTLSASDVDAMLGLTYPFELRVIFTSASPGDLENIAHAEVTAPNVVVIAVDAPHHHVAARFGTATGVKAGDFDSIAKAGNAHFRSKEWTAGIDAIALRARASAESKVAISVSNEPVIIEQGLSAGAWVGIALLFAATAALCVWLWRRTRRQQDEFNATTERLNDQYLKRDDDIEFERRLALSSRRHDPGTSDLGAPLTTGPTIIQNRDGSDFLTGMVVGDMLSHHHDPVIHEHHYADPDPTPERDRGGSDSFWDGESSSFESSASEDSGGSAGSFDVGGGDSGGGSDSGGGGGDW